MKQNEKVEGFEDIIKSYSSSMDDLKSELILMRNEGLKKGAWTGFLELSELLSFKRGSTTYLVAPPHVGKSSFINEIVDNLVMYSGWKIVIYSPETGSSKDVFNELLWTHLKQPFIKNKRGINATDAEVHKAFRELSENIRVLDFGIQDVTVDMIYRQVDRLRTDEDFAADMIIIDPMAEIKTASSMGVREDIAIGDVLNKVRRYSSKYDVHTLLAVHTRDLPYTAGQNISGESIRYQPMAKMSEIAGGQMYARKGMMIVILWRPPVGLPIGTDGSYYIGNETIVRVEKAKPKTAGSVGECILRYDRIANRYFEIDESGNKNFSYPCPTGLEEREVSPNYKAKNYEQSKMEL